MRKGQRSPQGADAKILRARSFILHREQMLRSSEAGRFKWGKRQCSSTNCTCFRVFSGEETRGKRKTKHFSKDNSEFGVQVEETWLLLEQEKGISALSSGELTKVALEIV